VIDRAKYLATIEPLRRMDPAIILSTHLPPASGRLPEFIEMLAAAPLGEPFVGPEGFGLRAREGQRLTSASLNER
jgi:hypothetical protein